jgi:hypothetical protein
MSFLDQLVSFFDSDFVNDFQYLLLDGINDALKTGLESKRLLLVSMSKVSEVEEDVVLVCVFCELVY